MMQVDELFNTKIQPKWSFKQSCHLSSDIAGEAGEQELRAFARRIGLQERWIQHPGKFTVHYDLTPSMRAKAVKAGATEVKAMDVARKLVARMKEART